ncbi:MAG: 4-hydroxy-tetrahydrodipicolinate synthase [Flammeovirgaceae bacterium]
MDISSQFRGVGAALVTPFDAEGNVDFQGLENLLKHTGPHLDYFVVNGTTAESPTLSKKEKQKVLQFIIAHNPYHNKIVFGIGGNNTQNVLETIKETDFEGIDAILSVSPAYNKPSQEGIYQHYKAIADACPVPVILYNVPPRTSSNMLASTSLRLASHPNVIAVKEAAGDLVQCQAIVKDKPADFLLLSGDDLLSVPMISIGGSGVISVIANAFPEQFCAYVHAALDGDYQKAQELMMPLLEINQLLFAEGNPSGVKLALEILGVCEAHVRLPLIKGSEDLKARLTQHINQLVGVQA